MTPPVKILLPAACAFILFLGLGYPLSTAQASMITVPAPLSYQEPTPAPQQPVNPSPGGFPILGVLVLLAPLGWMVWQSAGQKTTRKITATCCLPVIDEDNRSRPAELPPYPPS